MNYSDYTQEVVDVLCDLEGSTQEEAEKIIEDKEEQIRYGYQYRLSSAIIAGSILGINDCCMTSTPQKL
ncbi:MAG: hypothetical protein PHQ90_00060 [Sulfuricurvum sp.]|nr:hypothetical protein [Sulfuricurvum sp.]